MSPCMCYVASGTQWWIVLKLANVDREFFFFVSNYFVIRTAEMVQHSGLDHSLWLSCRRWAAGPESVIAARLLP